jgi:hypothetical protein
MTPSGGRTTLIGREASGDDGLDQAPPGRKVVVAGRKCPNTVKMVGQDHPGIDRERADLAHCSDGTPQEIDMPCQQVVITPLQEIDGEEKAPSRDAVATVVGNGASLLSGASILGIGHTMRRVTLRLEPALRGLRGGGEQGAQIQVS